MVKYLFVSDLSQIPNVLDPVLSEFAGTTTPLGTEAASAGAKVFKINCEVCHSPKGHGGSHARTTPDP